MIIISTWAAFFIGAIISAAVKGTRDDIPLRSFFIELAVILIIYIVGYALF